ncbi:hypothetical protein MBLNU459_g0095t1 [Dothideomycetes sp. NU459]
MDQSTDQAADQPADQSEGVHQARASASAATSAWDGTESPGSSEAAPNSFLRGLKKRMPLTNVACSECRKRKTKCDGQRPRCASCARRNILDCQYELESNQTSRIAGYKSKIEQQETMIEQLQSELQRLHQSAGPGVPPSTAPVPSAPSAARLPRSHTAAAAAAAYRASGPSTAPPLANPQGALQNLNAREQEIIAFARSQALERERFGREGVLLDQQRALQYENLQLKELLLLLTLMEDRALAQRMALKIREDGVTDNLLAQAQALYAGQPPHIVNPSLRSFSTNSAGTLPAISTLNLPPSSVPPPLTPSIDPRLRQASSQNPPS